MTHRLCPLLFGSLLLGLGGCTVDPKLSLGVADPCASMASIIADFDAGFGKFRGAATDYKTVSVYRTRVELIRGHCEIWAWAGGDHAYVCSADAPNQDVATARYNLSLAKIQQCLSSDWASTSDQTTRDGNVTGVVTRFVSDQHPGLVVSVQNIVSPSAYRVIHSNYLFIGSAAQTIPAQ